MAHMIFLRCYINLEGFKNQKLMQENFSEYLSFFGKQPDWTLKKIIVYFLY